MGNEASRVLSFNLKEGFMPLQCDPTAVPLVTPKPPSSLAPSPAGRVGAELSSAVPPVCVPLPWAVVPSVPTCPRGACLLIY